MGEDADPRRKYCSTSCKNKVNMRRHKARQRKTDRAKRKDALPDAKVIAFKAPEESEDGRGSARRGPQYRKFVRSGLPELISTGQIKTGEAAERYGCTSQAVSRWMAAWYEDKRAGIDAAHWERNDEATGDFDSFSRRYFPDLLVPQFHVDWSRMVTETLDDGGRLLLLAPQRHGKAIDADEEILTRERGWVRVGDVQEGWHIPGTEGWTKVVGVHDQGVTDAVAVTFSDGSSVVTNPSHKWTVRQRYSKTKWHTKTSDELREDLFEETAKGHRNAKWRIPVARHAGDPTIDSMLPVHPYLLGCWLGDGSSYKAEITTMDADVLHRFELTYGPASYEYKRGQASTYGFVGGFYSQLKDLGVLGNKHIPDMYLRAGYEAREALLAGLMDTDGTVNVAAGTVSYCTTSPALRDGFCQLVASLGGVTRTYEKKPFLTNDDGERIYGKTAWDISIRLPADVQPFALDRKSELVPAASARRAPKRLVHDISYVSRRQTVCFTVDADDHLFMVGRDFIVTHNSEMLIRYCLWRIVTNPDISIIWVGKTASLAEKMVGYIRQILEHHEVLRDDFLPPGEGFEPPNRSGLSWTNGEFTVSNRTKIRKSPTMAAIGVGGTILGRDADLVIVDDPIDRKMMASADARDKVAEWFFTDLLSRKEEDTGLAYIGSRQHVDDLPARIMTRPDWRVEVYQSHDPTCPHPEHDIKAHVDCVLWPDKRSFKWLMEQKNQNPDHFERNYQNNPSADTFDRPTKDDMERAWDQRVFGRTTDAMRLLASVDPGSGVKKHAICVWAYSEDGRREIVDVFKPNAGTPGMARGIREVYDKYRVVNWIFEKNRYEDQIRNDDELQNLRSKLGLNYYMHFTSGVNKHDPAAGVMAMLAEFRKQHCPIRIPGGNPESRLRMAPLVREILTYDPDFAKSTRHSRDDLVMAMWVGWYWMTKNVSSGPRDHIKTNYPTPFARASMPAMGWGRAQWRMPA